MTSHASPPPTEPPRRGPGGRLRDRLRKLAGDDLVRRLARGGVWAVAIKVAAAVLSLMMLAALARAMNTADFGRFAFGYSFAMVLSTVAGMGLQTGILRWRPENEVAGDPALAAAAERWGMNMTLAASMLLAGGVTLAGWAAGDRLGRIAEFDLATLIGAGALTVALAVSSYQQSALRARGVLIAALLPREVLWRGGVTVSGGALALATLHVTASEALWISAGLLGTLTLGQALRYRLTPGRQAGPQAPGLGARGPARDWVRQAGPMWGSAVLGVLAKHFEVLVIGLFFSAEVTGMYFAALSAASALSLFLVASNMISGPMISRAFHSQDLGQLQKMLRLVVTGLTLPVLGGLFLFLAFGKEVMSIFDSTYQYGAIYLAILSVGMAVHALTGPTGLVLQLTGHERVHLKIMTSVVFCTIILQLALIPMFGLIAAALINATTLLVWNLWMRRECLTLVGVDPTIFALRFRF